MSFRLRRVCRLRKGQGKRELGVATVARIGKFPFIFTAWTRQHSGTSAVPVSSTSSWTVARSRSAACFSRIRRLMLFLRFVVASVISIPSGLWTLTCVSLVDRGLGVESYRSTPHDFPVRHKKLFRRSKETGWANETSGTVTCAPRTSGQGEFANFWGEMFKSLAAIHGTRSVVTTRARVVSLAWLMPSSPGPQSK